MSWGGEGDIEGVMGGVGGHMGKVGGGEEGIEVRLGEEEESLGCQRRVE